MAVERLLGTANLLAVDSSGAIAPDNRMLGYNWKTDQPNKQIVGIYVKMPPAATEFAAGTRAQVWKRATPISASTLELDINIGGGAVTGAAGSEQLVPGSSGYALVQNAFYFTTIFQPFNHGGNYWFKSLGSNPGGGSLSGNCIFKNTISSTINPQLIPPDDETFTNGRFGVDVAINDIAGSDITATLALTLPVPQASLDVDAIVQGSMAVVLPLPQLQMSTFEEIQANNLREYVWNLLRADPQLNSLGINENSLFGTLAADSPSADLQKWMVIRWGLEEAPLHRDTTSRRRFLSVWGYDRRRDFADIDLMLHRARAVLYPLKGINYNGSDGWITEVTDNGFSDDVWDPDYEASTRNWQATIIASGI